MARDYSFGEGGFYDRIADALLKKEISPEEAERMTRKKESISERKTEEDIFVKSSLQETTVEDIFGNTYACATTSLQDEGYFSGGRILNIDLVESRTQRKGYFSKLLGAMESMARNHEIVALTLEVDESNDNAIAVYEHKGFYETGRRDTDNTNRIHMRKDLEGIFD